jgi:hypothetical protein
MEHEPIQLDNHHNHLKNQNDKFSLEFIIFGNCACQM